MHWPATDASAEWKSKAQVMLVSRSGRPGRHAEAAAVLKQRQPARPSSKMLGTERMAAGSPPHVRRARAQRNSTRSSGSSSTAASSTRPTKDLRSLAGSGPGRPGRTAEAIRAYSGCQRPIRRRSSRAYARLLSLQSDRPSLKPRYYGRCARSKPQSARWPGEIPRRQLHYRLGNPDQAAKIITLLSPPS